MTAMTEPGDAAGFAVRLTARLPAGDSNGLRGWARLLVQQPRQVRVAVVALDTARVIDDIDSDTDTAVVRLLRVEMLTDDDALAAQQLMIAAATKRGGDTLADPADFEAWAGVDPESDDDASGQ